MISTIQSIVLLKNPKFVARRNEFGFFEVPLIIKKVSKSKTSFLENIDRFVDWKPIELLLNRYIKRNKNAVGNPAFKNINMFKILLLQNLYNLSDREIDDSLSDRISFRIFVGFSFEYSTPDYTTICKFRNLLVKHRIDKKLFEIFNKQIEKAGLLIRKGAIVDASIIDSSRNSNKFSSDKEAKKVTRKKITRNGYKINMATSPKNDMVLSGHITPANRHDTKEFKKTIRNANLKKKSPVYADKGYPSKDNSKFLKENGFLNRIMHKACRNKKLSKIQKKENSEINKKRPRIEKVFGTLKTKYGLFKTKYLGIAKTNYLFLMSAICFNIKKACFLQG